MIRAHKIRLNPNEEQEIYFRKAAGTKRFVFNWALDRWKWAKEQGIEQYGPIVPADRRQDGDGEEPEPARFTFRFEHRGRTDVLRGNRRARGRPRRYRSHTRFNWRHRGRAAIGRQPLRFARQVEVWFRQDWGGGTINGGVAISIHSNCGTLASGGQERHSAISGTPQRRSTSKKSSLSRSTRSRSSGKKQRPDDPVPRACREWCC